MPVTNILKQFVGHQVNCMLFLSDLTKLQFSRHCLISVAHYKISRNCVLREPCCSIRMGRWTEKQEGNDSCYHQVCELFKNKTIDEGCSRSFLEQMILIII